jgi:hypothetical protein
MPESTAELIVDSPPTSNDFTVYVPKFDRSRFRPIRDSEGEPIAECEVLVRLPKSDGTGGYAEAKGRALVCSSFSNAYWSITIRDAKVPKPERPSGDPTPPDVPPLALEERFEGSRYEPPGYDPGGSFVNSIAEVVAVLDEVVFGHFRHEPNGLVVVTGRTGIAKSLVLRGLVYSILQAKFASRSLTPGGEPVVSIPARNPHVVTFEDPIEKHLFESPEVAQKRGIDYTPRLKSVDAADLKTVLRNALRQTPTAVVIGELRDPKDWRLLIDFAGTGHLAFVTCHAGTLSEALAKILRATRSTSPARRSEVAERMCGLIHLRNLTAHGRTMLVPAVWRRTTYGTKALMAEGLGSLVPYRPDDPGGQKASLGRAWFVRRLLKAADDDPSRSLSDDVKSELLRKAIELDLGGQ